MTPLAPGQRSVTWIGRGPGLPPVSAVVHASHLGGKRPSAFLVKNILALSRGDRRAEQRLRRPAPKRSVRALRQMSRAPRARRRVHLRRAPTRGPDGDDEPAAHLGVAA